MALTKEAADLFDAADAVVLSDGIGSISSLLGRVGDRITLPADLGFLDNVGIVGFRRSIQPDHETDSVRLLFATEVALDLPGLNGTALVLGSDASGGTVVEFELDLGPNGFALRISGDLGLRFSQEILRPARWSPAGWEQVPDAASVIRAPITLTVDADGVALSGPSSLSLSPSFIGGSGVVVKADHVTPVFSDNALPAIRPPEIGPGWRGLFIESADVYLPAGLGAQSVDPAAPGPPPSDLAFDHCYIGSGGFTGSVTKNWPSPEKRMLFGMELTLEKVEIAFRQSIPVATEISGTLLLPFFDGPADVEIGIGIDGRLLVGLSKTGGLKHLVKPNLLDLELDGIAFEVENGVFYHQARRQAHPPFRRSRLANVRRQGTVDRFQGTRPP